MKKKFEFSKVVFIIVIIAFILVIGFSMALMWYTQITDALAYLVPSVSGLAATAVGFYSWKSRAENLLKIKKENNMSNDELNEFSNNINNINDINM